MHLFLNSGDDFTLVSVCPISDSFAQDKYLNVSYDLSPIFATKTIAFSNLSAFTTYRSEIKSLATDRTRLTYVVFS